MKTPKYSGTDPVRFCVVDGCGRPAQRAGLCWGHVQRRQRGQRIHSPLTYPLAPDDALLEAALDVALMDDVPALDRAFSEAWESLKAAARRFAHADAQTRARHAEQELVANDASEGA